jgi:hypothetical protein
MSRGWLVVKDQRSKRRSPMKAGGGAVRVESGAVRRLSVTVGGQGRRGGKEVGEEARCTGMDEKKKGETRDGVGRRLLWRLGGASREEKGKGSGSVPRGGRRRRGEGGPGSDVVA